MDELVRLSHGLWRSNTALTTVADRWATLLTAAPADAVFGGLTSGRALGFWLPTAAPDERAEVVIDGVGDLPRMRAHTRRSEMRTRRRRLGPDDVVVVDGLPVTAPARTWVDLAEQLDLVDLVAAGDSVLRSGVGLDALTAAVRAAGGRRGVARARRALPLLDARSRSRMESLLRAGLVVRGLPKPDVNKAVYDSLGQWLAEPDLGYEQARLALEYNGADHAEVGRMRRDISRGIDLDERGDWLTVTVGPAQVFRQMDRVAVLVRRHLVERAAL